MDAGFETEAVDIASKRVVFRRVFAPKGMQDEARMFEYKNESVARHPALGAMKGTFTIEPGYDLAQSPFSAQELAEMDANLDRTADLIEAGMKKKSPLIGKRSISTRNSIRPGTAWDWAWLCWAECRNPDNA